MIITAEKIVRILKDEPQFNRERHGSLYDRGSADSYYHRGARPHWWPEGTGKGQSITELTREEVEEYLDGYEYNEQFGDKKEWR
jgi:hypothetical protein